MGKAVGVFAVGAAFLAGTCEVLLGGDGVTGYVVGFAWGTAMTPPLMHIVRESIRKEADGE